MTVRRATAADLPALTRMLRRAFLEDPLVAWSCGSTVLRPAMLDAIHRARLRHLLACNEIWITPEATSAALWTPPGSPGPDWLQSLTLARGFLHPRLMWLLPKLALSLYYMQRRHPHSPPHWYLSKLATEPDLRGRGLASAVLRPVLERCDSDGVGAYLETSTERNLDYYAHHGFGVTAEQQLPRGPKIWFMWREPRR